MKKRFFFVAAAALALLATACSKDKDEMAAPQTEKYSTPITLTANYGNGSKVSYADDGNGNVTSTWESGDKIIVCYDGDTSELNISGGTGTTQATFTGNVRYSGDHAPKATTMLVCYVKDKNAGNSVVTVDGTGTYLYTDDVFKGQDGTLGGAAKLNLYYGAAFYGNGNITCNFSVNTSLMKFTLINVSSSDADHSATLSYMSNGTEVAIATFTVTSGDNTVWLSIPAGAYSGVQKLVYTCGDNDNRKEHELSADHANFVAGKTYSKTVSLSDHAPDGAINGLFSVSSTKKVYFSQGNLQYQASSNTWKFAENQYDYIGDAAGNTTAADRATQSNWIDLFGWGAWCGGTNPWNTSTDDGDYQWGSSEPIAHWRTLSSDEWNYLLNTRAASTVNGTDNARYARANLFGTHGLIIFPDSYDHPAGVTTPTGINDPFTLWSNVTQFTDDDWDQMEGAGCVFLPTAGCRQGTGVNGSGVNGYYWSSTSCGESHEDFAYSVWFTEIYINFSNTQNISFGLSVRLVQDY